MTKKRARSAPFAERAALGDGRQGRDAGRTSDAPKAGRRIGRVRVIPDFMPAPAGLVPREENVKVTLSLSRRSLDFFKREAKKRRVPIRA